MMSLTSDYGNASCIFCKHTYTKQVYYDNYLLLETMTPPPFIGLCNALKNDDIQMFCYRYPMILNISYHRQKQSAVCICLAAVHVQYILSFTHLSLQYTTVNARYQCTIYDSLRFPNILC